MSQTKTIHGLMVIDKPLGMSSRDAVNLAWRWLPRGTRIGHTGTLDPLATGVLVVCVGIATRLAEYVQRMEKVYRAGIRLGTRSSTDDGEGTLTSNPVVDPPDPYEMATALESFLGNIDQVPPDHSAAKVAGRRAYAVARQGREVTLAARPVMVHAIDLLEYDYPRLGLEVRCGKGTYIRALARDLGECLGCGAYLESLRRTRVGHFLAQEALSLDSEPEAARRRLLPLVEAVRDLRSLVATEEQTLRLHQGQSVMFPHDSMPGEEIAVLSAAGALVAVGKVAAPGVLMPRRVFLT